MYLWNNIVFDTHTQRKRIESQKRLQSRGERRQEKIYEKKLDFTNMQSACCRALQHRYDRQTIRITQFQKKKSVKDSPQSFHSCSTNSRFYCRSFLSLLVECHSLRARCFHRFDFTPHLYEPQLLRTKLINRKPNQITWSFMLIRLEPIEMYKFYWLCTRQKSSELIDTCKSNYDSEMCLQRILFRWQNKCSEMCF